MNKRRYCIPEPTAIEAEYEFHFRRVELLADAKEWSRAQAEALAWSRAISLDLRLAPSAVWKVFKRRLAARWFGAPEHRVFSPPWQPTDVIAYLSAFADRPVRVSSFAQGIACHAPSQRLPACVEEWPGVLAKADPNVLLEAFPESSTPSSLCFRRYCTAFGESVIYEAGRGQAMPVFESDQGNHSTVSARQLDFGELQLTTRDVAGCPTRAVELVPELQELVRLHDRALQQKCASMARRTGIEWTSLEGYFDPARPGRVTIVDLDLPFDYVFMA